MKQPTSAKQSYERIVFLMSSLIDICFLIYWLVVWLNIIPEQFMFKDYANPILQDWNWSFLPLDLAISATGLTAHHLWRMNNILWKTLLIISLSLMFCAGLQAIAFWWLRADFDLFWWIPNIILICVPILSAFLLHSRGSRQVD